MQYLFDFRLAALAYHIVEPDDALERTPPDTERQWICSAVSGASSFSWKVSYFPRRARFLVASFRSQFLIADSNIRLFIMKC